MILRSDARRELRAEIERRSITINQHLIDSFDPVSTFQLSRAYYSSVQVETTLNELESDVDTLVCLLVLLHRRS